MTSRTADEIAFDLMATSEGRIDPYPLYEELRAIGPVRSAELPVWYFTNFEDTRTILRDNHWVKSDGPGSIVAGEELPEFEDDRGARSMLFLNPPDHTRLRGLVSRAFTPRRVQGLHERIETMVDELLDDLEAKGDVNMIDEFAYLLPVRVISEMIGVPLADRDYFRPLTAALVATLEPVFTPEQGAEAQRAAIKFRAYFDDLIQVRREDPKDDLLSGLIEASDGSDALSHDEIISTIILIYAAGFETTTNLIGNGIYNLLRYPDQLAKVRADLDLVPNLVEEVLRFDSPVQLDGRMASEDIEIAGVTVPKGETAITLLGAANRDPSMLDHPDAFDVTRTDIQVMSFASGIHFCLGAWLARMEGRIAFDRLFRRFSSIEASGEAEWKANLTLRGLKSLPVRITV